MSENYGQNSSLNLLDVKVREQRDRPWIFFFVPVCKYLFMVHSINPWSIYFRAWQRVRIRRTERVPRWWRRAACSPTWRPGRASGAAEPSDCWTLRSCWILRLLDSTQLLNPPVAGLDSCGTLRLLDSTQLLNTPIAELYNCRTLQMVDSTAAGLNKH